jgi:hypothetical protein
MASTKQVQQIKCGIGLNTIIVQYETMPNKKKNSDFFYNGENF